MLIKLPSGSFIFACLSVLAATYPLSLTVIDITHWLQVNICKGWRPAKSDNVTGCLLASRTL